MKSQQGFLPIEEFNHGSKLTIDKHLNDFQYWQLKQDKQGILWLLFDRHDVSVNTIDTSVLSELKIILDHLEKNPTIPGLVIASAKENGFIAGADIQQLRKVDTLEEALELIQQGQEVFRQLARLPFKTIALIKGFCLGGGLELALACTYRVAVDDPKTRLGLPEVMLGVHPGWGGSVRLPRLIGGSKALELIISGRSISSSDAYKIGMVDANVPLWNVKKAIAYFIFEKGKRNENFINKLKNYLVKDFTNSYLVRITLAPILKNMISKKVNPDHYPAPFAVIENWRRFGVCGMIPFKQEAISIAHFMISKKTKNMVRVFNLQEKLKGFNRDAVFDGKHIHVVGIGVMGGDIALWAASKGYTVTIQDENIESLKACMKRAFTFFKKSLKKPRKIQAAFDRIMIDPKGEGIEKADLIIEAIVENIEAKQKLFVNLEKRAKKNALFATNTSTIPLKILAEFLENKTRLVGLHFFNPVAKMPLVEVIQDEMTDLVYYKKAFAFVHHLEKYPLMVKSSPLFLVNRVLMPYLMEAVQLLEEGVEKEIIDQTMVDFGMPMGPLELMDTVGLDVCHNVLKSLQNTLDHAINLSTPSLLNHLVSVHHLGKKTGQGFYKYENDKAIKETLNLTSTQSTDIRDRMLLRMLNEAMATLRENIVQNEEFLDAGMIFGSGFPPFRGGPICYIREQGVSEILNRLRQLYQRYGERFKPDTGWGMLSE